MYINKITIKDTNISLNIKQFAKKFKELKIVSLMNLQLSYDQINLNKILRNLIKFFMSFNLLQNCTLIQNRTNLVA